MHNIRLKTCLLALALCLPALLAARPGGGHTDSAAGGRTDSVADARPITRATLYGAGFANMFDTYLSPQEYRGPEVRILRESTRQTRWADGRLYRQVLFQGYVNYTHNHVDNNDMISSLLNWSYGLHYAFDVAPGLRLLAGGMAELNGGFLWNLRNGNNPASARAYACIDVSGAAVWNFRVRGVPLRLRYQLNLPVAGVAFSPGYGQSYYEIFSLGHADGVVRFTSLHNLPSVRQLLSLDFPVGRLKMRVAYECDLQQSRLNGIRTHAYGHAFMVGFVKTLSWQH